MDLSRDVLFRLTTAAQSRVDVERMDANVWGPLDRAIALLEAAPVVGGRASGAPDVVADQIVRLKALRCWLTTQRDIAAWVAAVYGWMEADAPEVKSAHRRALDDMMAREIANTRALMALLDSGVEFMATTDLGETPLIHGRNLRRHLETRIALMERHAGDDPFIDHDYMMRMAARALT